MLVSGDAVPLYDPLTVYQQLMHEGRSRVTACKSAAAGAAPWQDALAVSAPWLSCRRWHELRLAGCFSCFAPCRCPPLTCPGPAAPAPLPQTPRLSQAHWRRSSPYFSLTRQHAELAAGDQEVYQSLSVHGDALADHYLPSLLSALGRENETACDSWGVAFTGDNSGSRGAPPKEYRPEDATPQLIQAARGACSKTATLAARGAGRRACRDGGAACIQTNCLGKLQAHPAAPRPSPSPADAHGMFLPFETVLTAPNRTEACRRLQAAPSQPLEHPLPPSCPLTALPFTGDAAPALLRLFAGTCAAADASPPAAMTKAEAEADRQLFLLRGRACALAKQQHLIF